MMNTNTFGLKNKEKGRILFFLGSVLIAALYIWRLRYGNAELDEAFYMTIPFRMLKGDTLLMDEWHVTQLSGFLLTPFMALQRLLVGSMEGVALNFRIFWLIEHLAVMTLVYFLLEKRARFAAAAAAWIYGLFTPFGIMALSYNSMGVDAVFLLAVLFYLGHCSAAADIFKGFLLAVMVLCNPYTLGIYAALMLLALVHGILRRQTQLSGIHVLRWHLGILILLIPFTVHVLSGMDSVSALMAQLRHILYDPAHGKKEFFSSSLQWIKSVQKWNPEFFRAYTPLLLAGLIIRRWRPGILSAIMLLCAYYVLRDARYFMYIWDGNSMVLFACFAGAAAFLFSEKKELRALLCVFALPFCYALCINMASNQALRSVLSAFMPACCLSMILLEDYCRAHTAMIRCAKLRIPYLAAAAVLALCVQLSAQSYIRLFQVFWEWEPPRAMTASIEEGPLKGIATTPQKKSEYERLCREIEQLGNLENKQIAFFQSVPIGFLIADAQMGSPSAWMEFDNLRDERLAAYYQLNPQNKPDILFVDRLSLNEWSEEQYAGYAAENGYMIERSNDRCVVMLRK